MANPRYLERPKNKAKLLSLLGVEGMTSREAATHMSTGTTSVTHQAVEQFAARHRNELEPVRQQTEQAVVQLWVTNKARRIEYMQGMLEELEQARQQEGLASGGRVNVGLIREMRGLLHDMAEQLGQIPRPAPAVNENTSRRVIIVTNARPEQLSEP